MKRIKYKTVTTALLVIGLLFVASCDTSEDPDDPADDRDKLVDGWTCNEQSSQTGQSSFTVVISKSTSSSTQVLLQNFYAVGNAFQAKMNVSGNTLSIPQQVYNNNQLNGAGSVTGTNSFSLTYYINNGSTTDTCSATFTRQ
jgi:hypothetical protein